MDAWPEIIFLDGTYKSLESDLTVMIAAVEDSVGATEIVGIALLTNEDAESMSWFIKSFKEDHESACSRIKCIMSDKDQNMRKQIRLIFENIPLYLCTFHTLQTYGRKVTEAKRDISTSEKKECLEYLQAMVFSRSHNEYEKLYKEFSNIAPNSVLQYFNSNWAECKNDWTVHSMTSCNFGNNTNNRLESLNAQAKALIEKRSTLPDFIRSYFPSTESRQARVAVRVARNFTTKPTMRLFNEGTAEYLYMQLLTEEAAERVVEEIRAYQYLSLKQHNTNTCTFLSPNNVESCASISSCGCIFSTSFMLPCRHIFSTRKYFRESLYSEELCAQRWTKKYCVNKQRCFQSQNIEAVESFPVIITTISSSTLGQRTEEKRMLIVGVTNSLLTLCSQCCHENYEVKVGIFKKLIEIWSGGVAEVYVEQHVNNNNVERENQRDHDKKKKSILSVTKKKKLLDPLKKSIVEIGMESNDEKFKKINKVLKIIEGFWVNR